MMTPYEKAYGAMMDAKVAAEHAHKALLQANHGVSLALETGHDFALAKSVHEQASARVKNADEKLFSAVNECLKLRSQP